jgi:hypothetical protein
MSARPGSRTRWIAGAALACVGALLVSLGGCIDEPLDPRARSLFLPEAGPLPKDNGFAFMMGFDAAPERDPRVAGAEWVAGVHKASLERVRFSPVASKLPLKGSDELLCTADTVDCVDSARHGNPAWFAQLFSDNEVLLQRYRALLAETDLSEHGLYVSFEVGFTGFAKVTEAQRIYHAQIAYLVAAGELDRGLQMLELENAFLRRWFAQAGQIIAKLVATRAFIRNLMLASEIARQPRLTAVQWDSLERVARPLALEDMSMSRAMRHEAKIVPELLDRMGDMRPATVAELTNPDPRVISLDEGGGFAPLIARHFIARNATLNFLRPVYEAWGDLDTVPTRDIVRAAKDTSDANAAYLRPRLSWVYNPAGRGVASEWSPDLGTYIVRPRDVDAIARAVCNQVRAMRQGVSAGEMATFLASVGSDCANPYTEKPFEWDAETKQIWFKPGAERTAQIGIGGRKDRVGIRVGG